MRALISIEKKIEEKAKTFVIISEILIHASRPASFS